MSASRTVKMAWLLTAQRPFWTALLIMAGIGGLVLASQMMLAAPIMPGWRGILTVIVGFVPELFGILGPVAALIGSMVASQSWKEGGEFRGLVSTGVGMAPVFKAALLWGGLVGTGVAACTHILGPKGRALSRQVVQEALQDGPLSPGVRLQIGGVFLGADPSGTSGAGVVVAGSDWVAWAERGVLEDGGVQLTSGQAKALDDSWRIRFEEARWPLPTGRSRPHNFSRTTPELSRHILAQRSARRDTGRAELTLMKRSTLAISAPLFAVIGVCMALTRRRPVPWAVALIFGVWLLQRVADYGIGRADSTTLAVAPLAVLCLVVVLMLRQVGRPA